MVLAVDIPAAQRLSKWSVKKWQRTQGWREKRWGLWRRDKKPSGLKGWLEKMRAEFASGPQGVG
jgi:hypothetical protein